MPLLSEHSKIYSLQTGAGQTTKTIKINLTYNEPGGIDLFVSAKHADVSQVDWGVLFSAHEFRCPDPRKSFWFGDNTSDNGLAGSKVLGITDAEQLVQSWDKPPGSAMRINLTFTVPENSNNEAMIWVWRRNGR